MTAWPFDPKLKEWGATYRSAQPSPGQPFWKITLAQGPMNIGDNHHIFVDVWDEQGNRLVGVPVIFFSPDEEWPAQTSAKPGESYAVDFPMYAGGNAYGVRIDDGSPSAVLFGMGLGSFDKHQSFRVVFQRQSGVIAPSDPPTVPPTVPNLTIDKLRLLLQGIRDQADLGLELLAKVKNGG